MDKPFSFVNNLAPDVYPDPYNYIIPNLRIICQHQNCLNFEIFVFFFGRSFFKALQRGCHLAKFVIIRHQAQKAAPKQKIYEDSGYRRPQVLVSA